MALLDNLEQDQASAEQHTLVLYGSTNAEEASNWSSCAHADGGRQVSQGFKVTANEVNSKEVLQQGPTS